MVIGIEAERANLAQKTGVEHYAKQLILSLAKIDPLNSYILYLRSKPESWFLGLPENFKVKVMPFPIFWTQIRLSWEMFFHPVDVLFIPASALPIVHPKKSVSTIHDLAWNFFPETYGFWQRMFLRFFTWYAVKFDSKVIAVSEATRKDIVAKYRVNAKKVAVVHHGYDISESADRLISEPVKQRLPQRYVLFLSTLQPRKNLEGLISAFKELKKENPELPHKLVVVGKPGWKYGGILKQIYDNEDIVLYFNHVSEADKALILLRADVLVLPSLYEGFGMQILESYAAGAPVAASGISSMPEVAGNAAVYFDPKNTGEIKNAIKLVLTDQSLAQSLREKGRERLKNFSWEKCAKETLEVLISNYSN